MRRFSYLLFLLLLVAAIDGFAQGVLKTEYMPASSFRDEAGNKLGSGDLLKFTGAYTLPFSLKQNASRQPACGRHRSEGLMRCLIIDRWLWIYIRMRC